MADDEKEELVSDTTEPKAEEQTPEEVSDAPTPEAAETPEVEAEPVAEEVSDTPSEAAETPEVEAEPVAEEVSDTPSEAAETPEVEAESVAEEVSDTPAPEAPAAKTKSRRHVPRPQRRTRTKTAREKAATRKPITRTEKPATELGRRQERRGIVVSDKGDKTIVVKVDVIKSHAKYRKVIRRSVKFHAHDEQNAAGVGDTVRIVETRPISKSKHWRLAEVVEKAK
jgi:small subunit ribosomal protein S17